MRSKGIDVSEHQGVIDWAKVAKDGVQFAVIRAGYGRELSQKDKQFERNYAGAKAAGIKVGAYWYSYADSVEHGEQEARTCLKVLEGKRFELPIFFDQEYEKSILVLSNKTRTDIVLKFLETVKGAGRKVGLYSSTNFITTKLQADRLTAYPLWIAEYGSKLHYTGKVWAWQYTSKGRVNGIRGNVDCNHGYFAQPHTGNTDLLRKGDRGDDIKLLQHLGRPDRQRRERVSVQGWSDRGRHCRSKNQGGAHPGCNPSPRGGNWCIHGQAQVALPG